MAASPDPKTVERKRLHLERKNGYRFVTIRASNGEVAILPACLECGRATSDPTRTHEFCRGFREHINRGGTLD